MPERPAGVEDLLAGILSGPAGRALEYLEAVEKRNGKAIRMDFLRIAGNEAATDRWISFFVKNRILEEAMGSDGSRIYMKTPFGQRLHQVLQDHRAVKIIIQHLSGRKLRP